MNEGQALGDAYSHFTQLEGGGHCSDVLAEATQLGSGWPGCTSAVLASGLLATRADPQAEQGRD